MLRAAIVPDTDTLKSAIDVMTSAHDQLIGNCMSQIKAQMRYRVVQGAMMALCYHASDAHTYRGWSVPQRIIEMAQNGMQESRLPVPIL